MCAWFVCESAKRTDPCLRVVGGGLVWPPPGCAWGCLGLVCCQGGDHVIPGPVPKCVPSEAHSHESGALGMRDPRPPCPAYGCSLGVGPWVGVSDGQYEFSGWVCLARVRARGARRLLCLGLTLVFQAWNVSCRWAGASGQLCLSLAGACGGGPGTEHVLGSCPAVAPVDVCRAWHGPRVPRGSPLTPAGGLAR